MNDQEPILTDLERQLREEGWRWSDSPQMPSEADLAAWVSQPSESDAVESLLAADATWRRALVDMRLNELASETNVPADLLEQITLLMPEPPAVLARIGGWALAAAACILLAIAGWQLGTDIASERSMDNPLAIATFGLSDDIDDGNSFLVLSTDSAEATR
ncbi:MAG: hypothetical protein GY894_10635 [Planctomycetes bacterium]|jgi:hypothetical protein|nr:hypothetical protein [Planctomycetota bacterium]MCP4839796.1 hypothetical protein [Planctomycetota bacterium]